MHHNAIVACCHSQILREVSELVDGEVRSLKALMLVEGAAKQIFSKAAMPSTQTIARKLYSVELLDISAMS